MKDPFSPHPRQRLLFLSPKTSSKNFYHLPKCWKRSQKNTFSSKNYYSSVPCACVFSIRPLTVMTFLAHNSFLVGSPFKVGNHLIFHSKCKTRAFLVAQWLGICLPMQGTRVRALVWENPTCLRATKPVHHSYWACALEPTSHNYWSPCATTTEAHTPRARAPWQEKPPQWEACAPQRRVAPARHN